VQIYELFFNIVHSIEHFLTIIDRNRHQEGIIVRRRGVRPLTGISILRGFQGISGDFSLNGGIIHPEGELVNLPLFLSSLWGYWRESVP